MRKIIVFLIISLFLVSCSKKQEKYGNIVVNVRLEPTDIVPMNSFSNTTTRVFLYKFNGKQVSGKVSEWAIGVLNCGEGISITPDYKNDCINNIASFSNIEYGDYLLVVSTDAFIYPVIKKMKIALNTGNIQKNVDIQVPIDLLDESTKKSYLNDIIISETLN
jgi:hypothetical protein